MARLPRFSFKELVRGGSETLYGTSDAIKDLDRFRLRVRIAHYIVIGVFCVCSLTAASTVAMGSKLSTPLRDYMVPVWGLSLVLVFVLTGVRLHLKVWDAKIRAQHLPANRERDT